MASTNAYRAAILATSGLVSYWRMKDAPAATVCVDENSAAHNGTYSGGPDFDRGTPLLGDSTGSVQFNYDSITDTFSGTGGSSETADEFVTFTSHADFNHEHTAARSIEAWVWIPANIPDGEYTIFSRRNGGSPFIGYDFVISVTSGNAYLTIFKVTSDIATGALLKYVYLQDKYTTFITKGCWHHLVSTDDGSQATTAATAAAIKSYIDGVVVAERNLINSDLSNDPLYTMQNSLNPRIARTAGTGNAQFAYLKIKDLAFYNVALSGATITAHYAAATTYTLDYAATGAATNIGPCKAALQGPCDVYFLADSITAWNDPGEAIAQHMPDKLLATGAIPAIRGRYCQSMSVNGHFDAANSAIAHGDDLEGIDPAFAGATDMGSHGTWVDFNEDAADDEYLLAAGTAGLSAECPAATTRVRMFVRQIGGSILLPQQVVVTSWRGFVGVAGDTLTTTKGPQETVHVTETTRLKAVDFAAHNSTGTVLAAVQGITDGLFDETTLLVQGVMTYNTVSNTPQFMDIIGAGGWRTNDFWSDSVGNHHMFTTGDYSLAEFFTKARLSNTLIVFDCTGANDMPDTAVATWSAFRSGTRGRFAFIAEQAGYSSYIHVYVRVYRAVTGTRVRCAEYAAIDAGLATGNDGALNMTAVLGSVTPEGTGSTPIVDDGIHPANSTGAQALAAILAEMIDGVTPTGFVSSGSFTRNRGRQRLLMGVR